MVIERYFWVEGLEGHDDTILEYLNDEYNANCQIIFMAYICLPKVAYTNTAKGIKTSYILLSV